MLCGTAVREWLRAWGHWRYSEPGIALYRYSSGAWGHWGYSEPGIGDRNCGVTSTAGGPQE